MARVQEEGRPGISGLKSTRWMWEVRLDILVGFPMANPGVATPPAFRGVVAYLLRDSPSLAPVEAPLEIKSGDVMVAPTVATLSATQIVQDEATGVTYVDTMTTSVERVSLGNPCMAANLQGPMLEDITNLN